MEMPRNARSTNDLQSDAERRASAAEVEDTGAPPPFAFTPTGADPALGWSGWGAGSIAPWTQPPAELHNHGDAGDEGEEQDRPRREPRKR